MEWFTLVGASALVDFAILLASLALVRGARTSGGVRTGEAVEAASFSDQAQAAGFTVEAPSSLLRSPGQRTDGCRE